MAEPCEVHLFSIEKLLELFSRHTKTSTKKIEAKLHATYFREYFNTIGTKTIVVENEYVDHDFLEDYAEYYVRCFQEYPRKCTRLHFFKTDFTGEDFSGFLIEKSSSITLELLQENYLGFIVVKPLPRTIIGRTCLITYQHEERRYFPATRCYIANLFGFSLKVEHTLAFQEQDAVVAACATSALWSIFQATGHLFQHPIPSPSAITNQATEVLTKDQRAFPSPGLTSTEMAHAIKRVGLEPFPIKVTNHYLLKATLYAYLRAGIPMMFGFLLVDTSETELQDIGRHAVAITGYSLGHQQSTFFDKATFLLKSTRIDRVYVHDDQVGPFSRMVFDGANISIDNVETPSILTSWIGKDGNIGSIRAISDILLIPLYHKIRIPFGVIHDIVLEFDFVLKQIISGVIPEQIPTFQQAEWDIYLITVNDLKREVFNMEGLSSDIRKNVLLHSFPRFLWRATLVIGGNLKLDLVFDATDIEQGAFFLCAIEHDVEFNQLFRVLFALEDIETTFGSSSAWPIIAWFRNL